jgi:hypothetical protein
MVMTGKRCNSPKDDHAMATRRANASNNKALDAFMTTKFQIGAMLERLKALSEDHFEAYPDEISWGHVGTLNHYASLLRQITDSAFKEGEHAA